MTREIMVCAKLRTIYNMPQTIDICIKTAESTLFQGQALSLSSVNDTGPFDILGFHENFISLIQKRIVITKENGETVVFPIPSKGILHIESNKATVFLGVEVVEG